MIMSAMEVMLLAAGRGTRLQNLGLGVPKILVDVGGEPLLAHQLRYVEREGATRVVINAHHLAEQVLAFASRYDGPLELLTIVEPRLLGTAGAVRNALHLFRESPFVVLYGDVLIDATIADVLRAHRESGAVATLTAYESGDLEGKGVLDVDGSGRVTGFVEKGRTSGRGLVNAGLYVVERSLIAELPPGVELDFGHDVLPTALADRATLHAYRLGSPVIDVGTPAALALAQQRSRPT
jgi:mannose-1-phosphate guanylyltransferase